MDASTFDFDLPEALIALRPASPRSSSRLLVCKQKSLTDAHMSDLPGMLRPGDRLVFNDTRVIQAKLPGLRKRPSSEVPPVKMSINLDRLLPNGNWRILAKPGRRLKAGDFIEFGGELRAKVTGRDGAGWFVAFNRAGEEFDRLLEVSGEMPLPPYIASRRLPDELDRTDYQTVFARHDGSVAAPTASLHFDEELLAALQSRRIDRTFVTLHVGAGTFLPIKTEQVEGHRIHPEWGRISQGASEEINFTKRSGGRVIAVGTTALRLIESAASGGSVHSWQGDTDLFIRPGYRLRIADGLVTNFHLPRSTLIVLVAALMGHGQLHKIYSHAIRNRYRFYSYGDCSLLLP